MLFQGAFDGCTRVPGSPSWLRSPRCDVRGRVTLAGLPTRTARPLRRGNALPLLDGERSQPPRSASVIAPACAATSARGSDKRA